MYTLSIFIYSFIRCLLTIAPSCAALILFPRAEVTVEESEKRVRVNVYAERKKMKLQIRQSTSIVEPERKIRRKRLLEEVKDSIGSESTVKKERGGM